MLKIILLLIVSSLSLFSQSLSVFDIDTTTFPVIKAKLYAFDTTGNQILNLSTNDFEVQENGIMRKVLSINCPEPKPPVALSSVLVMDVSGSMQGKNSEMAREGALAWIYGLPLGNSECAITSFNTKNYFVQDFTSSRYKLRDKINSINNGGRTDYNAAFSNPVAGGILVAKTGKHKKVIIIISDGQPNFEPNTNEIISQAKSDSIIIFSVTLGFKCPQCLKDITKQTGGLSFENIKTVEQAREIYRRILNTVLANTPCELSWESRISCKYRISECEINCTSIGAGYSFFYQPPLSSVAYLEIVPNSIIFLKALKDTCLTIRIEAKNSNFEIKGFTVSNPSFRIEPYTGFALNAGESRDLTLCYTPADSGYAYCEFVIENDLCPVVFHASGGFPGKKPNKRTLKLIHPNGGEVFVAGSDTVITWEGISPNEPVDIEYSTNKGLVWITIEKNVLGLYYNWLIPNTPSNNCIARVTSNYINYTNYPEVLICKQIWMKENLDVDTYRNGDLIKQVKTRQEWNQALMNKEGAWCYYENSYSLGRIYGKLYNFYALSDPRGLAPEGWHIPSVIEWQQLEICVGGQMNAACQLKSIGTTEDSTGLWLKPNICATNVSGFSALPGGCIDRNNGFRDIGKSGYWWFYEQSMKFDSCRKLTNDLTILTYISYVSGFTHGFSVRCVKD